MHTRSDGTQKNWESLWLTRHISYTDVISLEFMKGYDNDEDDREDITASHSSDAESDVEDQEDCDLSQSEEQLFL